MKAKFLKIIALTMAIAMLALCMAGCGGNQGSPASSGTSGSTQPPAAITDSNGTDEEITITFWHTYGDSEEAQFLNVVMPLWEAAHPNIKVEAIRQDSSQYHSSDEHVWFVESRKSRDNPYRDYYIWRNGKGEKEPNNWSSFFTQSAWSYDQDTDQWYLHLFSEKQPDLNWENPRLREDVYAMMNRWFDKGVDGFRMDVISLLAKAPGLPDGEGDGYVFSDQYFAFQPKLHDYLREMRRECFDDPP